jgi:peptidoglycan/LPS O-acetylase OafA/YrhL
MPNGPADGFTLDGSAQSSRNSHHFRRQDMSATDVSPIPRQRSEQPPAGAPRGSAAPHVGFRPDIEGLRAIAVTLVVLSHAGVAGLAGGYVGVDVFFVISGFLITTLLVKELTRSGRISLAGFYARRAVRLLPASTVVLVATVAASWQWLPPTRFKSISLDGLFSTFYGINWRLAYEGVQYLNADAAPSPLQHFWSLAVEEQFYLVWPLLLLIFAMTWMRRGKPGRLPLIIALCAVVVVSLTVSVTQTTSSAPWAYFGAHTRAWELGAGALVAMAASRLTRVPKPVSAAVTWTGVLAVLAAAVIFDEQTAFPGYAAALPVLGSAAIIAGGCAAPRRGAAVLLGTWPFQQIGKYSYSWYLWHWPVLMIAPVALHRHPTLKLNLALGVGSLLIAIASYHLVENPVRTRSWIKARKWRGLGLGLTLSASAAALALIAGLFTPALRTGGAAADAEQAVASASDPAAELRKLVAASVSLRELPSNVTPKIEDAKNDLPRPYADHCHIDYVHTEADNPCMYGDPNGTETVYLLGDSHGGHWFPAMDALAKEHHWKLATRTKSACQAPSVLVYNGVLKRQYDECVQWRDKVLDEIVRTKPLLVVMSSNGGDSGGLVDENNHPIDQGPDRDQLWAKAWTTTFEKIKQSPRTKMVMIADTPWPQGDAAECVAAHSTDLTACRRSVAKAIVEPKRRALVAQAAAAEGVTVVDPTPWFCLKTCPAVIGNILVWKDNSHISTAFSLMLAPLLEARLPV